MPVNIISPSHHVKTTYQARSVKGLVLAEFNKPEDINDFCVHMQSKPGAATLKTFKVTVAEEEYTL